jgi:hypothetical protein
MLNMENMEVHILVRINTVLEDAYNTFRSLKHCGTSSLLHLSDNRLTDGGETVRFMRRPPFTTSPPPPSKIPGTHFC